MCLIRDVYSQQMPTFKFLLMVELVLKGDDAIPMLCSLPSPFPLPGKAQGHSIIRLEDREKMGKSKKKNEKMKTGERKEAGK